MGEVTVIAPRRRKVRCPNCRGTLAEPGSPIYECPFCFTLLLAKGTPPDFNGQSWQMPMHENHQDIQGSQQTNESEASSIDGSEPLRSQRHDQLNDHETNGHVSVDGNIRQQDQLNDHRTNGHVSIDAIINHQNQLNDGETNGHVSIYENIKNQEQLSVRTGIVSGVENRREQEPKLENDTRNGSISVGDTDKSADHANKTSTASGGEGIAVEIAKPLDCGKEDALASSSGESGIKSVVKNKKEQEPQLKNDITNGSVLVGDIDKLTDYASKTSIAIDAESLAVEMPKLLDCRGNDVLASSSGESQEGQLLLDHMNEQGTLCKADEGSSGESQEGQLLLDHMNEQGTLCKGDQKAISQVSLEDTENCSMHRASEEEKVFVGECEGLEGRNPKEYEPAGEGSEQVFQSEIVRDNDAELSFKYISSMVESNGLLAPKKRMTRLSKLSSEASTDLHEMPNYLTERLPSSSDKDSDGDESYSIASESASLDSEDSEFDFPSPSAEIMHPSKIPHPDVSTIPHQLEWQDVDLENEETALQNSNGATDSCVGVDAESASDVVHGMGQGGQLEKAEFEGHLQKEDPKMKETLSVGLQDTAAIDNKPFHVQRQDVFSRIGATAEIVGSADLKGGCSPETKEDSDGYEGNPPDQLNEHTPMLSNDLQEEVLVSLDLSSSGVEHPLKLKSGSTLKEGSTASKPILGMGSPTCLLSDGSESQTCSATQENIKPRNDVANVKLDDSIATIAREKAVIAGDTSLSKIPSQIVFFDEIQERVTDPSHLRQNMGLLDTNNQSRRRRVSTSRASTSSEVPAERDGESVNLAPNKELEYAGMQSFPFVTEQTNHDSRRNHQRGYSSRKSELSSTHTSQAKSDMHNEGLHMPRSTRIMDRTHQKPAQAVFEPADGQGPWMQKLTNQAGLHMMGHGKNYSGLLNDAHGFPPASSHYGSPYYSNGSDSFTRGAPHASLGFSYQAPSHPWGLPVGMPGVHCGYHSAAPTCTACIHCQHSHFPQPSMPPFGFCFNQPLSMAHQHVQTELWNGHQAHQIQPSDHEASVVCPSSTYLSPQPVHRHHTVMSVGRPLASSPRKHKHYPPLPGENTAPYIICKACDEILQVPTDIPLTHGATQKLRCGGCYKVAKFCVSGGNRGSCNEASSSVTSDVSASTSQVSSHAVRYPEYTRQPPLSNVPQSMESSYHQGINSGLHTPYKQGSFGSQQQISAAVSRRSHPSSLDEIVQSTQCETGTTDHDSQDEFFFRSLSRHTEFDSSRIFFNGFKASSSAIGSSSFCDDGLVAGNGIPLQAPVDEKEEGLDFGAPRISDGESLGQRSPESRIRSPENKPQFQVPDRNRHAKDSLEDGGACWTAQHQAFDLKRKIIAQGKKPSPSLIALLSQESSKFEINTNARVSFDDATLVLWPTESDSQMHDCHSNGRSNAGSNSTSPQPRKLSSTHLVRRGPRYVTDMLRRSLKDFRRGSQ